MKVPRDYETDMVAAWWEHMKVRIPLAVKHRMWSKNQWRSVALGLHSDLNLTLEHNEKLESKLSKIKELASQQLREIVTLDNGSRVRKGSLKSAASLAEDILAEIRSDESTD